MALKPLSLLSGQMLQTAAHQGLHLHPLTQHGSSWSCAVYSLKTQDQPPQAQTFSDFSGSVACRGPWRQITPYGLSVEVSHSGHSCTWCSNELSEAASYLCPPGHKPPRQRDVARPFLVELVKHLLHVHSAAKVEQPGTIL